MSDATLTAVRGALRIAADQLAFIRGERRRAWNGDFVQRMIDAAMSGRPGCGTCSGLGYLGLPPAQESCAGCDPQAPGFAPVSSDG